mgnify:CR=1 FL=1
MSIEKELENLELVPEEFLAAVSKANKKVFDAVIKILSELEVKDGIILSNVSNLQKIELIAQTIRDVLLEGDYIEAVKDYTRTFESHGQIVLNTFDKSAKLSENEFYQSLIKQTQSNVLELFDSSAIEYELVSPIKDLLTISVSSNLRFSDAVNQIRDFIEGSEEIDGALSKYASTYARDAFAMFDRNFSQVVNQEYDVQYWEYAGSMVQGTRDFCKQRVGKAYTREEIESWASLKWQGKNENTTRQNIFTYLGGYNCMHTLIPISKERYEKLK